MSRLILILSVLALSMQACTDSPKSTSQQATAVAQQPTQTDQKAELMKSISSVWATGSETVTIDYDDSRLIMLYGDQPLQFALGDIDLSNETVNLIGENHSISTLRKVWNPDKTAFRLSYTSPDGRQDVFNFVRKVTTDDKNRIATIHTGQAQQALADSQSELTQLKEQYSDAIKENKLTRDEINALWKKFDPDVQAALIEEQRTWVIQKKQKCGEPNGTKAKPAAIPLNKDDFEKAIAAFECDTQMTRDRIIELNGN